MGKYHPTKTVWEKAVVGENQDGRQVLYWTTDNHGKIAVTISKPISDTDKEAAWLLTKGTYVLETSEAPGWLRIRQWNGSSQPAIVGTIEGLDDQTQGGTGAVRAITLC
ncbi:MAG: hypothetical protein LBD93_07350 [Treponema sp.]|nr:hypothetical protein [Treponema sp.]